MRYLIDEDLSTNVAVIARGHGLDAVSAQEVNRRGWTEEQQLAQAAEDGRCIVTANRDDFRRLTNEFGASGRPHAGVLVVPETVRRHGATQIARALVAFERERGDFPFEYVFDFLSRVD